MAYIITYLFSKSDFGSIDHCTLWEKNNKSRLNAFRHGNIVLEACVKGNWV